MTLVTSILLEFMGIELGFQSPLMVLNLIGERKKQSIVVTLEYFIDALELLIINDLMSYDVEKG